MIRKKTIYIASAMMLLLSLTSCADVNRREKQVDDNQETVTELNYEYADFVLKGEKEVGIYNAICRGDIVDESMVIETTYTYTEIQLSDVKWCISELDGNPCYEFVYNKDTDIEKVREEMSDALYASMYPDYSVEYLEENQVLKWISEGSGVYSYDGWIWDIEDIGVERNIKYYEAPWR